MRIYFANGDKGNFLIATSAGTAKFSYPDEDGMFEGGVDLYADNAADELRKLFPNSKGSGGSGILKLSTARKSRR